MRKITSSIAALGLVSSVNAYALGVGNITTSSALNQTLNAKIALISSKNEDPSNLRIKLASREVFQEAGIDRSNYLLGLNFEPVVGKNGDISIQVSSDNPIKEPFVNFILEVEWPKGRALREFTILLDPPVTMRDIRQQPITAAVARTTPKATTQTAATVTSSNVITPAPVTQKKKYGPTKRRDTLWGIAKDLIASDHTVTHEQMMLALYDNNPKAFYKKNINALKRGQILEVPNQDAITQRSTQQAISDYRKQNALWSSRTSTKVAAAKPTATNEKKLSEPVAASEASEQTSKPAENDAKLTLVTAEKKTTTDVVVEGNTEETPTSSQSPDVQANLAMEMATTLEQENAEVKSRLSDLETQVNKLERLLALKDQQLNQLQSAQDKVTQAKPAPELKKEPAKRADTATAEESQMPLYAGGAILIALLGAFLARRRKENTDESTPFDTPSSAIHQEPTLDDTSEKTSEVSSTNVNQKSSENATNESASLLSEFTPSEFSNIDSSTEADPLTECDVYIAYGRFQQAEDLIQSAINEEPDNVSYKQKLLDVYLSSGNAEGFENTASQLISLKESDPAAWAEIANMGSELAPDSALFSESAENDNANFSIDIPEKEQSESASEESSVEISIEDIPVDEPQEDEAALAEEPIVAEKADEFEFDFDLINKQEIIPETSTDEEPAEIELEPITDEDSDFTDNSADTKLSLAEAYIEMEDFESAKETLNEVLASGTEDEIARAQTLFDKI